MIEDNRLFTDEQSEQLVELMKVIINSKYKDPDNVPSIKERMKNFSSNRGSILENLKPGAYDINNPETRFREHWRNYVTYFGIHGVQKNKKGTKFHNTSAERTRDLKYLARYLGHNPTSTDLKEFFQLPSEFDSLCESIDKDIQNLI
jgi:hypothetical protein